MELGRRKAGLRSRREAGPGRKVPRGRSLGWPARISSPLLMMGVVLAASELRENMRGCCDQRSHSYLALLLADCFGEADLVPFLVTSEAAMSLGDLESL